MQSNGTDGGLPTELVPAGLDRWSEIRNLHASSFRKLIAASIEPEQVDAFVRWVNSPDYTDILQTHDLHMAVYGGRVVGTAGWVPSDDSGASARITAVFVAPLFLRLTVGRRLVEAAEARAAAAGFRSFTARAFSISAGFFEALGYQRSSQGVQSLGQSNDIPIIFLKKTPAAVEHHTPGEPGKGQTVAQRGR